MRVRLSGATGNAGDCVLIGVVPERTTLHALVAHWADSLGLDAAPCTAVARLDGAGAAQRLRDPEVTLSAAGVADGNVVLVALAPGFKLITLRLSAGVERTVALEGPLGMANLLRRFNAQALRKVGGALSPQAVDVSEFGWLQSGATYAPVPRAPPAAVRDVTLLRELLPPLTDGAAPPPLLFASLTDGALESLLSDARAAGVSAARAPLVLLGGVAALSDGATYYYLVPLVPGNVGEAELLKQQVRAAAGAVLYARSAAWAVVRSALGACACNAAARCCP